MSKRESNHARLARAEQIIAGLRKTYPDAHCELNYGNPLQLLIATILSAQCTDKQVNLVTAQLFKKYPTALDYANANPAELARYVITVLQGMAVQGADGASPDQLRRVAQVALRAWPKR